ncbi:phage tail protein, partial [Escherichia coli]|uniref:phage major tail tube protein n=1 Tax=Escherichia coli TaxID=562 RepID=UPI0012C62FDD
IGGFEQTVTLDARGQDSLPEHAVTVEIAVSYYRQTKDGRELFEIDTERFSRRVNGVDVLSGLAAKVRL